MKRGLAVVTMILGLVVAVAGIATAVSSIVNLQLDQKYLD